MVFGVSSVSRKRALSRILNSISGAIHTRSPPMFQIFRSISSLYGSLSYTASGIQKIPSGHASEKGPKTCPPCSVTTTCHPSPASSTSYFIPQYENVSSISFIPIVFLLLLPHSASAAALSAASPFRYPSIK